MPDEYRESNYVAVATGLQHACGILGNSSIVCWGEDRYGQLGNAEDLATKSWVSVSAFYFHTCGIRGPASGEQSGRIECWGAEGEFSMLGMTTLPAGLVDAKWVAVAAGAYSTCGNLADSYSVEFWGCAPPMMLQPDPASDQLMFQCLYLVGCHCCHVGSSWLA